jgi:hypothetical protein
MDSTSGSTALRAMRAAALAIGALVAACGGGGGDPAPVATPAYGAGAVFVGTVGTTSTVSQALIAGRASPSDADAFALAACNVRGITGCEIAVRFGPGRCGAIAYGSSNPTGTRVVTVWGAGEGASQEAARSAAVAACAARGGTSCAAGGGDASACNDPA